MQNKVKEKIIKKSYILFAQKGIHNVPLTTIAVESEVGVATIYRYFGTKQNILNLCANYLWEKISLIVESKTNCDDFNYQNGFQKIEQMLQIFITLYKENKDLLKFIAEYDNYVAKNPLDENQNKIYNNKFLLFHELGKKYFEAGVKDESIKNNLDFDSFYFTITRALLDVSMKGASFPNLVESDNIVPTETQLKQLIKMAMYYCKKGE